MTSEFSSTSSTRAPSLAPLLLCSAGIFILAFWLLTLLPGRETQDWAAQNRPTSVAALAYPAPETEAPRILPSNQTLVLCKSRFYHWDEHCALLNGAQQSKRLPIFRHTRAEAESLDFRPCDFCGRHFDSR